MRDPLTIACPVASCRAPAGVPCNQDGGNHAARVLKSRAPETDEE